VKLDLIDTLALAGVALLAGHALRRYVPALARFNVPAPVIGGLLVALAVLVARSGGTTLFDFDTTLQRPLMVAFFTTIGFAASVRLLQSGGPLVFKFFLLAAAFSALQSVIGVAIAAALGLPPLLGVLAGTATLSGGPATGLAFAPAFEAAGITGAASIAVAVAMAGIVLGGVLGGPVAGALVERHGTTWFPLVPPPSARPSDTALPAATRAADAPLGEIEDESGSDALRVVRNVVAVLVAMWAGGGLSAWIEQQGVTLPSYIGAMLVAAVLRNVDDRTGWIGLDTRWIGEFGAVTLSLFLVLAIMTLKLWELAGLALPLFLILVVQVVAVAVFAYAVVFRWMGRDYEATVMSGGFVGFMLGTTANAMAVMRALVDRYGPAPTAFLVAPTVGAFFIDFANALIITAFLNLLG
jgi:ESS family glutamate:Na+ symporter